MSWRLRVSGGYDVGLVAWFQETAARTAEEMIQAEAGAEAEAEAGAADSGVGSAPPAGATTVHPYSRVGSNEDSFVAPCARLFVVRMDNSYSWMRAKEVELHTSVEDGEPVELGESAADLPRRDGAEGGGGGGDGGGAAEGRS